MAEYRGRGRIAIWYIILTTQLISKPTPTTTVQRW